MITEVQSYQANFHLTGLTSTEYSELLSYVIKIGKTISFGGGVDNIETQKNNLFNRIMTDLSSTNLDVEKQMEFIKEWKLLLW